MFTIAELTHPVTLGGVDTRGIYDESGELMPLAGAEVQHVGPVLYVVKGALPALTEGTSLVLGTLGADDSVGGRAYQVHRVDPVHDGLILAITIGGGR